MPTPKVLVKFNSLYPKATAVFWHEKRLPDSVQRVDFDCNCQEGIGHLVITFDTTGGILEKDILVSVKYLPGNILNYIENNYPNGFKYGDIDKINDNSGGISYQVTLLQTNPDGDILSGGWTYILKFKASGEYISVEKRE